MDIAELLARRLAQPLARVSYPVRLDPFLRERGARTVKDLVEVSPRDLSAWAGCGPRTVLAMRRALRSYLGVGWEEARLALGLDSPPSVDAAPDSVRVDPQLRAEPVAALPPKLAARCRRAGISVLGEIESNAAALEKRDRRLLRDLRAAVGKLPTDYALLDCVNWQATVRCALQRLDERSARIVRRRIGTDAQPVTAQVVARELGLSLHRVQQLEKRSLGVFRAGWATRVATALERIVDGGVKRLIELGDGDPYFRVSRESVPSMVRFIDWALPTNVKTLSLGEELVVSAVPRAHLVVYAKALRLSAPRHRDRDASGTIEEPDALTRDLDRLLSDGLALRSRGVLQSMGKSIRRT